MINKIFNFSWFQNGCQMESITIRKFVAYGKTQVLCQAVLDQYYVRRLHLERKHVFILRTNCKGIEMRSVVSLELIKIVGEQETEVVEFQVHENKWIIMAGQDFIR